MSVPTSLAVLFVLLCLSAFFSASETALVAMTKVRVRRALDHYGRKAKPLLQWDRHSDRLLTAIVIGNNVVNIGAASVTAMVLSYYIADPETAVWVNTALMTTVILIFGEILPKQLGKSHSESTSLVVIRPVIALSSILWPLVWVFSGITRGVARWVMAGKPRHSPTRSELEAAVAMAGEEGSLATDEHALLREALKLRETMVREIMTPRVQMVTLARHDSLETAKSLCASSGFSRIPVTGADENEIVGVLFAKDLLLTYESGVGPTAVVVSDLMRPPVFVPEVISVSRLLDTFRRHNTHLLIVVGEYGDVTGLVTMEDLLEKLVGAIEDEFDREEPEIKALSERRFLVAATAQPDSIARALGVVLPEGEYETVAGYLIDRLGKIPPPGTAHRFEDWLILVYDADDRRVRSVTFQYLGMLPLSANKRSEIAL